MKIARYWTRESAQAVDAQGVEHRGEAWGWSEFSLEEARERALVSARRVVDWIVDPRANRTLPRSHEYQYFLDRPPREEIVRELQDAAGDLAAVVTRNSYGSLVLNARDLMFVDVDLPPAKPAAVRLFSALFGRKESAAGPAEAILNRMRAWSAAHDDFGLKIYRTAGGFRVAIVDRPMEAGGVESRAILEELGSDPLYRRLCDVQQCFRARLTPKPWRMRLGLPPCEYPYSDAKAEARTRDWQRTYDEAAPRYATCQLVEQLGPSTVHAQLAPLVDLHDALTGCARNLTLA